MMVPRLEFWRGSSSQDVMVMSEKKLGGESKSKEG